MHHTGKVPERGENQRNAGKRQCDGIADHQQRHDGDHHQNSERFGRFHCYSALRAVPARTGEHEDGPDELCESLHGEENGEQRDQRLQHEHQG